jgi:hypothetical protein
MNRLTRRAIQTFQSSAHQMTSREWIPKSNKHNRGRQWRWMECCSCLNEWLTQGMAPFLSQMVKNVERHLEMRRRSSRSKVEWFFKVVEWPAVGEKGWWPFITHPTPYTHTILTVGVSDHQIYLTKVGYVRSEIQNLLSVIGSDISDGGQMCLTRIEPSLRNLTGNRKLCHRSIIW